MTLHEITPKQLRALLLLLVLVPFIPMVLMLRFMADALEGERSAALERASSSYHQTLTNATLSLEKHLAAFPDNAKAEDSLRFYRGIFPPEIAILINDAAGKSLAGKAPTGRRMIAQDSLRNAEIIWQVQLYLVNDAAVYLTVRDQFKIYAWTAGIAAVAICAIAASAGLTLSNQFALSELKNTSTATVAHELRTPLASMRVLVDTLRAGRGQSEEQKKEYLDLIATENLRLSRLTDQFLTHSRLERNQHAFHFAPVAPRAAIDAAIAALREKLEAPGCDFTLNADERLSEILADHDGIVTILTNLLENALKYTGDVKRITLRAEGSKGGLTLCVSDNGEGLSRRERKHIFEPYFQVDQRLSRAREGCGLGLSIVQRIVTAHRGRISVTSEPGDGCRFTVFLPALNSSRASAPKASIDRTDG